jgi:hypothetical protein
MSDNRNVCLPFPCISKTTPVKTITDFHEEGDGTNCKSYYFTVSIDKFRPSPCSFMDTAATRAGECYKLMLTAVFHVLDRMFYGEQPDVINVPDVGGRRFRVFLEYLLNDDVDPEDFTLIDCVGLRFHINIYDPELNFMEAILKMIESNSGDDGSLVGETNTDPDPDPESTNGPRAKKRKKKKKRAPFVPRKPIPDCEMYKKITSTVQWLHLAGAVSHRDGCDSNATDAYTTNTDDRHIPDDEHQYHCDNLFSWDNSLLDNMKDEQRVEGPSFAFPQAVYYINGYMTNPQAILGVTLPRTPMWFKQVDNGLVLETMLSLFNTEYMVKFFERRLAYMKRNDLSEIKQVQDKRKSKILCSDLMGAELHVKLRQFRERSVKYLANAWNPTAVVSDPIKVMSRMAGDMETWYSGPTVITDKVLSSFGNFITDTMMGFENILRISTTHTTLLRCLVNSLDAYRYEFNLHNNILLVGAGATGKSHILEMLEKVLLVSDTVTKVSHLTDKAMTGDTDQNDMICTFHEMPAVLSGQDNKPGQGGDGTGGNLIKDMMTSCKVETQSIYVEDGRRITFSSSSERVSVLIMASNMEFDRIPEALSTRMTFIQVDMNERSKFSINDMTSSVDGVKGGEYFNMGVEDERYLRKWKVRQIILNMVEKMIYVGALEDVNIRVFETVQLKMTAYMKSHDIMQRIGNDRSIKFLKRFARTITILHAIDKFVSDPTSVGYDPEGVIKFGSSDAFEKLLKIQPYLFCTEEMALFTLTLNADQLIQVHHFRAIEIILACVNGYFLKSTDKYGGKSPDTQDGYWFTKAVFPDERYIYSKLAAVQNNDSFTSKMSLETIKVSFRELRRRSFNDNPIIEFNTNTQSIRVNSEFVNKHYEWDGDMGRYVCKFDLATIMTDVFNKSYANTMTREHKKSITGISYDREMPFLLRVMHKKPNPSHILTRTIAQSNNRKGVSGHEETERFVRHNDTIKFKVNFEDYCYMEYIKKCGYDMDKYSVTDTIYDHHMSPDAVNDYPMEQVKWFVEFTGVKPTGYNK